jgi:aspartate/methionine/tyrosine aminotransferase
VCLARGANRLPDTPRRVAGLCIRVEPGELELHRFERLVDEVRSLRTRGLAADASKRLHDALSLWMCPPLADFAYECFAQTAIVRRESAWVGAPWNAVGPLEQPELWMSVRRLEGIPGFNIDRVAAAAGDAPDVLRMENLDTDIPPPAEAMEATRAAIGEDEANSWLPFTGRDDLKEAAAAHIERRGGPQYDGRREIVITSGEGEAMLDALFCLTNPGDEVILTDPTYAGMINRVRLVGAAPRLAPLRVVDGWWRLDLDALRAAVTDRTRVIFINNASFPAGWVASHEEWEAITNLVISRDLRLLYWAAFEGVLFDGRRVIHPAAFHGMRDRTVTIGDPLEKRMIAWRVAWVVAPGDLVNDLSRVQIYNGLVPSGFAQIGVRVALAASEEDLAAANAEWQRRRDETLRQLDGLPVVPAAGGWSLLLDVAALELDCVEVSDRLLEQKVAATPMRGWGGEIADRHVRFVFSNEPVQRLALLGTRVRAALAAARQRTLSPGAM